LRNREGSAVIIINEDGFRGDDRRFGRWGGRDHGRFDDIFLQDLIHGNNRNDHNRNDINLNIVDLLLGDNNDRSRNHFDVGRNFNRHDDRLNEVVIIRLDEIHRARERDNDRRRREIDFLNRRRRDFIRRRDNVDVVIVIANPIQNRLGDILERPFYDYQYHLFHNIGATETQTLIFTDAVTLTVQQTVGPNGEQATAVPTAVDAVATPTSVDAVPTGVTEQVPAETGAEDIAEEASGNETPVEGVVAK
jgi:hypothetical protein